MEAILPVLIQLVETLVPIIMQIIEAVLPILQQLLEALIIFTAENALDCRADVLNHAPHFIKDGVTKFSEWAQENPELLSTIVKVAAALAGLKVGAPSPNVC